MRCDATDGTEGLRTSAPSARRRFNKEVGAAEAVRIAPSSVPTTALLDLGDDTDLNPEDDGRPEAGGVKKRQRPILWGCPPLP